jgi:hypothetical protein
MPVDPMEEARERLDYLETIMGEWDEDNAREVIAMARDALAAAPPPPDVSRGLDREALQAVGRRLQAEHDAAAAGSLAKAWRFREYQAVLSALSAPAGGEKVS